MFQNLKILNIIFVLNWIFFIDLKEVLCSVQFCQTVPFGTNSCKSFQRIEFQNVSESRRLLWTVTGIRGVFQCAEKCLQDSRCMTYFYNRDDLGCSGHSITFGNITLTSPKPGNRYYLMEGGNTLIIYFIYVI